MKKVLGLIMALCAVIATSTQTLAQSPVASGQHNGVAGEILPANNHMKTQHASTPALTNHFIIELVPYAALPKANPNWAAGVTAEVQMMTNSAPTSADLGNRIDPNLLLQDSALSWSNLWIGAKITGVGGYQVDPDMLRFTQWSSDGNSLANSYDLVGGNSVYNLQTIGFLWGSDGQGPDDTVMDSGESGSLPSDQLVFGGVQTPYYIFHSDGEQTSDHGYVVGQNMAVTTQLDIVGTNGAVLATAFNTMQVNPPTSFGQMHLTITPVGGGMARVMYTGDQYQSATIDATSSLYAGWHPIATLNNSNFVTVPISNGDQFFRARR